MEKNGSSKAFDAQPKVCIVSHNAYGAMTGGRAGHIGGVEWQTSLMAKWLAARGHRVSVLTWDEGGPAEEMIDGVRVIKMCRREAGVPRLRFFWPRWSRLIRALRQADADVYYHNGAEYVTGQVVLWCGGRGRRFVYSVASNMDCSPDSPELRKRRDRVLYRYGLRHADRVIAQTQTQQRMLREGFGVDSLVIPMPCPGPSEADYAPPAPPDPATARILWVGRICDKKRPDRFLELARTCPDLAFDFVGPPDAAGYGESILRQAAGVANLAVHGAVPRDRMPAFYRGAACLVCTSDFEGFPNTFLEAWSRGLPIVSTFDPDGLIASRGLGVATADVAGLAAGIRGLLASPERWIEASRNARRYYLENHTVDAVMPQFERVFLDVAGRRGRGT